MKQRTAIVVGAGAGGIATAARLAKAGFSVTIVEKNNFTGGRCSLIHHDGHRFDQGPSLLLLPKLFQETFHDLDTTLEAEGVQLLKCDPNYNLWFGDGESFELSTDTTVMKREIEKWEGKDGFERYLSWMAEAHKHYEVSVTEVLHKNFTSFFGLLRPSFLRYIITLHPFESIYSRASRYFFTDRLRRVFTFASMYMGISPFEAPGTYSLLQYTELAEGIWYPIGGFHAVIAALVKICERSGVQIRLSCPVVSVLTGPDGKTATGVELESGETITADIVIINSDLVYSYNNLFPDVKNTSYAKSLQKRDGSCSSISFYWSISQQIPELKTHNIFLADEYRDSFDAIFNRQSIPDEPSFYVNVPSRVDSTAAPAGKDSIVVLVPVGHLLNSSTSNIATPKFGTGLLREQDWDAIVNRTRDVIISTIEARTNCAPLAKLITHESLNTPNSWESTFNLDKGSILGLSHSFFNVLAFRPKTKHPQVKGVYFVGASTHPGTGVPIVLAGAKITTTQILQDLGIGVPWSNGNQFQDQGVKQGKGMKEIDRVQRGPATTSEVVIWSFALLLAATVLYLQSGW